MPRCSQAMADSVFAFGNKAFIATKTIADERGDQAGSLSKMKDSRPAIMSYRLRRQVLAKLLSCLRLCSPLGDAHGRGRRNASVKAAMRRPRRACSLVPRVLSTAFCPHARVFVVDTSAMSSSTAISVNKGHGSPSPTPCAGDVRDRCPRSIRNVFVAERFGVGFTATTSLPALGLRSAERGLPRLLTEIAQKA